MSYQPNRNWPIKKANDWIMSGKTLDDFNLPNSITKRIRQHRLSESDINLAYSKIKK